MRYAAFLALFAFLFCPSFAENISPPPILDSGEWMLGLYTPSGALPQDSIVGVAYSAGDGKEYGTVLAAKGSELAFYPAAAPTHAKITYDLPSTPALDYVWEGNWNFAYQNAKIILKPVADLAGTISNADGTPSSGANVEVSCPGGYSANATASQAGSFSFASVPAGKCSISANSSAGNAASAFDISAGEFKTVDLKLSQTGANLGIIAIVLIGAIALCWFFFILQRKQKTSKPKAAAAKKQKPLAISAPKRAPSSAVQPSAPSSRQKDLLSTLDAKEKSIVEFVQKSHPAAVKASKIRNALLIPKTSLTRTLQSLERKQFLELKKDGSRLHVKLHEFFAKE